MLCYHIWSVSSVDCPDSSGFIVDFIPPPVISGFTSAAAITIATGQIKVGVHVCVLVTVVCVCYVSVE